MKSIICTKVETVIIETKEMISMSQIVQELSMNELGKEEKITERYMRLDKGQEMHDMTHYTPRFDGNW